MNIKNVLIAVLLLVIGLLGLQLFVSPEAELSNAVNEEQPAVDTESAVDRSVNGEESTQTVLLARSRSYALPVSADWSVRTEPFTAGSVQHERMLLYDENGHLVMIINYPVREIGRPGKQLETGEITTNIGNLDVQILDVSEVANFNGGFAHYHWPGAGDFNANSFEILVPFRDSLYAHTGEQSQAGEGDVVRYASTAEFQAERKTIESFISGITTAN